ncbi:MAG: AraC family transcriptional regulator [Chloroflexi bacterium]|nr:AraC family transcriptional regulator [Chloroflexota bacterium]
MTTNHFSTHPIRPISGGTNDGIRPLRYDYWRTGYSAPLTPPPDLWVAQAGEYHCKPGYATGNFEHSQRTQLFYHLQGKAVWGNGRTSIPVTRGDLLIFPAKHSFSYQSNEAIKHHWLGVEGDWPSQFAQQGLYHLSLAYDGDMEAKFVAMREALILRKPGHALQAIGLLYELMARVAELLGELAVSQSTYPDTVQNAITHLRENYAAKYEAATTAAAAGVSQSHLRALFEKWLGESPRQFHTRYRIEQAARLLNEQQLGVAEVAYHLGFADTRHFSRTFKRVMGTSPGNYRRGASQT